MSATIREDGARCYGTLDDGQHGDRCYCGAPATRHVYYGTGCGHACNLHARRILRKKRLAPEPPYLVSIPGATR
jgi:hypothetical protein